MPHLKQAKAVVVHPRISQRNWGGVRRVASSGATNRNLTDQAREILGGSLDPDKYLFTHCTIVASVDTDVVPDIRLGKVKLGSATIDRRYNDYFIKPNCSQFVNNNGDSWSRDVLKMAYPTFVGAHNFLEHVQIEEKSKGRIIDAVARDIGDSLYVDILVATDRRHASLIQDIEAGKMATLSMGCTTDFTICTQCGHYAVDTSDLCQHIRYSKLNTFMDDAGQKRVIAELCGHKDFNENPDAPGGVRFIEASWVAVPAFPGAVMHKIMDAQGTGVAESEIRRVLAHPTPSFGWSDTAVSKAASAQYVRAFDFGGDEGGDEGGDAAPADPFKELEDSVFKLITDRVQERFKSQMSKKPEEPTEAPTPSDAPNDSIIKEGAQRRYAASLSVLVKTAASDAALVEGVSQINRAYGVEVSRDVYRAVLHAGSPRKYASPQLYLRRLQRAAGRDFSLAELRVVVRVGTMLSRWESDNNPLNSNR